MTANDIAKYLSSFEDKRVFASVNGGEPSQFRVADVAVMAVGENSNAPVLKIVSNTEPHEY